MTKLDKAVVLLTGAGGGFGQELVRLLLAEGCHLVLTDVDHELLKESAEWEKTAEFPGTIVTCIAADLSSETGVDTLLDALEAEEIAVEILVNNAGIAVFGRHDEVPTERWEQLMQINLLAPMRLCTRLVPQMIARRKGHIVNISSVAGWVGPAGLASYAASKFGLRGFSESLMDELAPYNVQVTAVYPYFSRTPILNAERHGSMTNRGSIPDSELTHPTDVMRQVILAIKKNQQHLFPDRRGKQIHAIGRFFPGLLKWLSKRTGAASPS